ncbi:MAG: hypothetical protein GY778_24530 [bacterium]|nr:hypothetical protein [bacterium]
MAVWLLASVAGGMLGVLSACKPADVSWKYVRLIGVLCLAMLAGATAWLLREAGWRWSAAPTPAASLLLAALVPTAALIGLAPVAARRRGWFVFVTAAGAVAAVAGAVTRAAALNTSAVGSAAGWVWVVTGLVASAFLLGSVTNAWLLGHTYLTATRMTIAPLRRFSRLLLAAVATRLVFALVSFGFAWLAGGGHLWGSWLILSLRGAVGLALPALFAWMVHDCVRLRSTQSATGILYFASLFVYVGELASQHLLIEQGWSI